MAALPAAEPEMYGGFGGENEPNIVTVNIAAISGTFLRGDFLVYNGTNVLKAATNPTIATVLGMSAFGSLDFYFAGVGGAAAVNDAALFGATVSSTALMPADANLPRVLATFGQFPFEMSLIQAWAPSTQVGPAKAGLTLDASGYFVADTTQSNKILNIIGSVDGPGKGVVGDTYKRVIVSFISGSIY